MFLQWLKFPSWSTAEGTQKCECLNMFLTTIILICLKKKSVLPISKDFWPFFFGHSTVVIVRKISLSFCSSPIGTDLFVTIFLPEKWLVNGFMFAYTRVHALHADIRGQSDNLSTTYILYDWQLKSLSLEIWILMLMMELPELYLECPWAISLGIMV